MNDLPPRKTLVMLYRSLQFAKTDLERREIVRSARLIRLALHSSLERDRRGSLSPLAHRILAKCAGQTLNSKAIARVCGMTPGGSSIKRAIRLLVQTGQATKLGNGNYQIVSARSNGKAPGGREAGGPVLNLAPCGT